MTTQDLPSDESAPTPAAVVVLSESFTLVLVPVVPPAPPPPPKETPPAAPDPKPMENKDLFSAEYKEVGDAVRHFSTWRSALTTFLITVAMTAFGAFFHKQQTSVFFIVAGVHFLGLAVGVCLRFSYLTEKYRRYHRRLWNAARQKPDAPVSGEPAPPRTLYPEDQDGVRNYHPEPHFVWGKMLKDWMNWFLVVLVVVLLVGFGYTAVSHNSSAWILIAWCVADLCLIGGLLAFVWLLTRRKWDAAGMALLVAFLVLAVGGKVIPPYLPTPPPKTESTSLSGMYDFELERPIGEKFIPVTVRTTNFFGRVDEAVDYQVGTHRLRVEDRLLFLDGTFRVKLSRGDKVKLTADGKLTVNGAEP